VYEVSFNVVYTILFYRKGRDTHWSSCTNMNVFADLLTFLRQERQFLEQTPFGLFYDMHHIKIQCQLLRHLMILEKENVRDDMFVIKINGIELRFGNKEFS